MILIFFQFSGHTREKTYNCTHCDKVFSKYENVKRHIRVVHEVIFAKDVLIILKNYRLSLQGIRAFHCTYCDQSFGKAETLKHRKYTYLKLL
jgi:uncharacterized C2H2 Zn-finger protein